MGLGKGLGEFSRWFGLMYDRVRKLVFLYICTITYLF
jgi:hypothetical protein